MESDDALEVDRIGLERVPLADDHVAVGEDADIVAVVDDRLGAREWREFAVDVNGLRAAGGADNFAGRVENDGEAGGVPGEFAGDGVFGPADTGVEFLAGDDGATDVATGDGERFEIAAIEGEAAEAKVVARGDEEGGFVGTGAQIDGDAVGGVEALLSGHAGFAAEAGDELPVAIVAQDEVRAVAVGDVDVAVGRDGGLGGVEGHLRLICADGGGVAEGKNLTAG